MARFRFIYLLLISVLFAIDSERIVTAGETLKIATFDIDVSPPVGSPLAYDPTIAVEEPLHCKGLVLLPAGQQAIVIAAIDWLGVANAAQDAFKQSMAKAARTSVERCVIHSIHQHDAPRCDLSAAAVLQKIDRAEEHFDSSFISDVVRRTGKAIEESMLRAKKIQQIRFGKAVVENVASNRRMLGPDGVVHTTRYTACRDERIRALPEGVVDPWLRSVIFDGEDETVAVLTTYATHPQSYYRTGKANPDFPGLARLQREKKTGVFHLHFNGAGGNIGAGKYNDGSVENRQTLASRLAKAMQESFNSASIDNQFDSGLNWKTVEFELKAGEHLQRKQLNTVLTEESTKPAVRLNTAKKLAYLARLDSGHKIQAACLSIGNQKLLFMPGELFVEYQLAAQAMLPDAEVLMAAYGEYGTGYIGTRIAYAQGGYEVSERASNVSVEAEEVLLGAMRTLLNVPTSTVKASDFTDTTGPLPSPLETKPGN